GCGFGGSCFPKDVSALVFLSKRLGYTPQLLKATLDVNERQPLKLVEMLEKRIGVKGKSIGILGLAFKPETDDVRDSPAIPIIQRLIERGATVLAYDPQGMEHMKAIFPKITYCENPDGLVEKSDAILLVTDWKQFSNIKTDKPVIDGKRVLSETARGSDYEGICW
ncbi:MAG: UDP binding domain-containing protein, partial [Candidatus Micrarchaeota archaeon]